MEPHVSATLVLDQLRIIKELHGEAIVVEAMGSLPAGVRQELRELLPFISVAERKTLLELHGWPSIPDFDLVGLASGIEAVLLLAGRVEPHVATSRRGVVVDLVGEWKASLRRAAGR